MLLHADFLYYSPFIFFAMIIQHFSLALLTCLVTMQPLHEAANAPEKWVVTKGCSLRVSGSTNMNKFSCSIQDYTNPDTLTFQRSCGKNTMVALSGSIGLPVADFNCLSNVMTNDLRKTLKVKEYPRLTITFVSLKQYPTVSSHQEATCGIVNIELAGVSKKFEINYHISRDEQQVIHLTGNQQIKFTDFNLTPPRKLGGIIRANDLLDVEFNLYLKIAYN